MNNNKAFSGEQIISAGSVAALSRPQPCHLATLKLTPDYQLGAIIKQGHPSRLRTQTKFNRKELSGC
jgi:hypothetical protein